MNYIVFQTYRKNNMLVRQQTTMLKSSIQLQLTMIANGYVGFPSL